MNGSLSEETMKKVELLWTKVGLVVQLSQMVEYNLANILGFDEILRKLRTLEENNIDRLIPFLV